MKKHFLLTAAIVGASVISSAQYIARFEVQLPVATNGLDVPASINLDDVTFQADSSFVLVELANGKQVPVPFQISENEHRTLYWLISTKNNQQKKREFQLMAGNPQFFSIVIANKSDSAITFQSENKNLMRFYYKTVYPPAGIDTAYKRSGFVHPLWTPHGQVLTRIQPPDHYHHYGIWNPWTHVLFEKDTVDFWNLKDRKGTVRFANFVDVVNGPVFSEFQAVLHHIVFKKDGSEKNALNELQTYRVYKPEANADYFIVDFTSQLSCATQSPFHILAYRYAGFGWRTTEFWDNNNCEVLTSEGKTRINTDGSKARWCIVQGALPGNDEGGAVMLSYPGNYNHPEPLRIWDKNAN
ncbi:MAG TPA: PmoA family protein, partial [Chitinophagaceae bacterium]|nr:PmoA family protein [Chitinophagaceae bacterium]